MSPTAAGSSCKEATAALLAPAVAESFPDRSGARSRLGERDVSIRVAAGADGRSWLIFRDPEAEIDRLLVDDGLMQVLGQDIGKGRFYIFAGRADSVLSVDVAYVTEAVRRAAGTVAAG